jgi:hypothetical protein
LGRRLYRKQVNVYRGRYEERYTDPQALTFWTLRSSRSFAYGARMDFLGDSDSDGGGGGGSGPLPHNGGGGGLRVNPSFAAAYDGEAARRVKQRWRDVGGRVPLPAAIVAGLVAGAKAALKEDGAGAAAAATRPAPADVVRWVMKDRGWRADADAAPLLHSKSKEEAAEAANPLPDDVASRLAEAGALKKAVRAAFVYIKKAAYTGGAAAASLSSAPGAALAAGRKRRRADSGSASDGSGGGTSSAAPAQRGPRLGAAADEDAPPAAAADDNAAAAAAADAPLSSKKHGRGAGRGRGLDFRGEPKFDDMHPSWQAKRRAARRQVKLVTKALRGGAAGSGGGDDADAAAVVIVVASSDGPAVGDGSEGAS